jgi:hypothetical protein
MAVLVALAPEGRAAPPAAGIGAPDAQRLLRPPAVTGADMASHEALYRMSLGRASGTSGIVDAKGAMQYQFADGCDGWTSATRTVLRVNYQTGGETETVWTFTNWESHDGRAYRFRLRHNRDGRLVEEIGGRAELAADGTGTAWYTQPNPRTQALPEGTVFPTRHLLSLYDTYDKGRRHLSKVVFDGSTLDNPFLISAVMRELGAEEARATAEKAELPESRTWWMQLAFFPVEARAPEPEFEVGVRYRADGIADRIEQDFGDFALDLVLDGVELLPEPDC